MLLNSISLSVLTHGSILGTYVLELFRSRPTTLHERAKQCHSLVLTEVTAGLPLCLLSGDRSQDRTHRLKRHIVRLDLLRSRVLVPIQTSLLMHSRVLRSEEHTSELQSRGHLVCRLLL